MPESKIPFNSPWCGTREFDLMREAVNARQISGNGRFTKEAEALLQQLHGGQCDVLLTTSCTHALEMSALLLNLEPGDEVILPSYTFVSTANAFVLRGAVPRFADIDPLTLNLCPTHAATLVTERTKAIVPVHYAGIGCDMTALNALAQKHHLAIIEDNAHGLIGQYRQQPLGTFGSMAALSFHETKNFSCGEGGALILNDRSLTERAEILREKGTDRSKFFRGVVDKYTWVDLGSSYVLSDMLAAYLLAQLQDREHIQAMRSHIWQRYLSAFQDHAAGWNVRLPHVPQDCAQAYHMFYLLLPDQTQRDALMRHLKSHAITAVFHYLPLHLSPMGQRYGSQHGELPVTEDVSGCLLRLPFYAGLTEAEQDRVIERVTKFFETH